MREASRKGAVLLALLLILPLIAAATIYLQRLTLSSAQREQIVNRIVRDTTRGFIPPIIKAIQLPASLPGSSSPVLLFDDLLQSSAYLLRINHLSSAVPNPNWHRLSSLPKISCPVLSPESTDRPSRAPSTCRDLLASITGSSFSAYNIEQTMPVTVHASPDALITIAFAGEFSSPIILNLSNSSHVEIAALGSVDIGALWINTSSPDNIASVLIYSKLGSITVTLPTGVNLCDSDGTSGPRIRIEAANGISINGTPRVGPAIGCEITRSSYFWPKSRVLALYYQ